MTELIKTLELKLVEPNAHIRRKLHETRYACQRVLAVAFDAGCITQSEANEVVVNYDLSGYAWNALKKYVPQLTKTHDAGDLHDDHPIRFTNEGLRLNHKPENAIEWYVGISHQEDDHLWSPPQPNPDHRDWLQGLNLRDAETGESRLFQQDRTWYLHVTATRDMEDSSEAFKNDRHRLVWTFVKRHSSRCVTATTTILRLTPDYEATMATLVVGSTQPTL